MAINMPTVNRARIGGVIFLVISLVALWIAVVAHKGLPFRDYTYVDAAFEDISSVRPGDDVRVGSSRIGQVDGVSYDGEQAVVTMQLPGGYDVYADATASIGARNALGQRFVAIDPGTEGGPELGDEVIPIERTSSAVELDQVLGELDESTRAALTSSVQELGAGAYGGGGDLHDLLGAAPEMLADLGVVSTQLTEDEAELVGLLVATNQLGQRFEGRTEHLRALLPDMADTMAAMATSDGGAVDDALAAAPPALEEITPALDDLTAAVGDLSVAMTELGPGLESLGNVTPELRSLLIESRTPLARVPGVAELAVPAFTSLAGVTDDLSPIAPDLRRTIELSEQPLEALAPYANYIYAWFDGANQAIDQGDETGNWLRFMPVPAPQGVVPGGAFEECRVPYPEPGQAENDTSTENC